MNQAWAAANQAVSVSVNVGVWEAIWSASLVVQLTLLSLVLLSIFCWAVVLAKRRQISRLHRANAPFLEFFWKANSLDDIFDAMKDHQESSLARVFKSGYLELRKIADSNLVCRKSENDKAPLLTGSDNLERALRKASDEEIAAMEFRLTLLATTGSTAPFIGLFGTVWGIMGAFQKIGATKVASLAVVAPGISEALIATAVGLAAAIPATIAYNHFLTEVRKMDLEMSSFASDLLNIAKRNFFQG
ncbi:MAG: protein TolQ [Bdellovibrionales bacterium]|nr:protein TolQ [Bdellovibrionales bacterium]